LSRSMLDEVDALTNQLLDLRVVMFGDGTYNRHSEQSTPGLRSRVSRVMWGTRSITTAPTQTHRESLAVAAGQFGPLLNELRSLVENDITDLEDRLEAAGAPYTPGRIPVWQN